MANEKVEVSGLPKSSAEYEQWITQGRTFENGKWYEPSSTSTSTNLQNWAQNVVSSTPDASSYLGNLLNTATSKGIDVNSLLSNTTSYKAPTTVVNNDYSGVNSVTALVDQQLKNIQAEKAATQKALEDAGKVGATDYGSLLSMYNPPTIDTAGATTTAETKYGTADALAKMQEQNAKVAALQGDLQKLETEELTSIDRAEGRVASRGAIEGEKSTITREYNIKKAYKSAELYAEAAVAQVYSDNYANAQNLVKTAVENYLTEIKQDIQDYNTLFSLQSDWIQSLKQDEKDLLTQKYNDLVRKEEATREEKMAVMELMLKYPSAAISITDSLEDATKKALPYEEAAQAAKTTTELKPFMYEVIDGEIRAGLSPMFAVQTAIAAAQAQGYELNATQINNLNEYAQKYIIEWQKTYSGASTAYKEGITGLSESTMTPEEKAAEFSNINKSFISSLYGD